MDSHLGTFLVLFVAITLSAAAVRAEDKKPIRDGIASIGKAARRCRIIPAIAAAARIISSACGTRNRGSIITNPVTAAREAIAPVNQSRIAEWAKRNSAAAMIAIMHARIPISGPATFGNEL